MEIRNHIYKFEVDNKETGKYIKRLRKEKGWTAEVLAEKLYCSPKTVSSWETGVRMPSLDMLVYLSELFGVSVHSLMLPLDNCPYGYIGPHSDASIGAIPKKYIFSEGSDEELQKLFVREEYLLQRMAAGVFNQKDRNELYTISKFIDSNIYPTDPAKIKTIQTDQYEDVLAKWVSLRIYEASGWREKADKTPLEHQGYTLYKLLFLFMRLYGLNNLSKTLKSINIIEKSILLTTCILCKKIRCSTFAADIYNSGGLFIKGAFDKIPSDIQELLNKEPDYLNEYHDEKDFYVEEESNLIPGNSSWRIKDEMHNYNLIMNYVIYLFYKSREEKINNILEESLGENYDSYLKKLEEEGQINA